MRICQICKSPFRPLSASHKFCGPVCAKAWDNRPKPCPVCGVLIKNKSFCRPCHRDRELMIINKARLDAGLRPIDTLPGPHRSSKEVERFCGCGCGLDLSFDLYERDNKLCYAKFDKQTKIEGNQKRNNLKEVLQAGLFCRPTRDPRPNHRPGPEYHNLTPGQNREIDYDSPHKKNPDLFKPSGQPGHAFCLKISRFFF